MVSLLPDNLTANGGQKGSEMSTPDEENKGGNSAIMLFIIGCMYIVILGLITLVLP
jgi:hypothetical protein